MSYKFHVIFRSIMIRRVFTAISLLIVILTSRIGGICIPLIKVPQKLTSAEFEGVSNLIEITTRRVVLAKVVSVRQNRITSIKT